MKRIIHAIWLQLLPYLFYSPLKGDPNKLELAYLEECKRAIMEKDLKKQFLLAQEMLTGLHSIDHLTGDGIVVTSDFDNNRVDDFSSKRFGEKLDPAANFGK